MDRQERRLEFRQVVKTFDANAVFEDLSFSIASGEFFVILGPSGCGKTTLLRLIAGLETVTRGEIRISGRPIQDALPGDRGVAMVFQDYALYPHLTVSENLAFGLRNMGIAADQIAARIAETARALAMEDLLSKKPAKLSGGQQQRVALGRALVKHPDILLMDEPLSALDPALRLRTRRELAQIGRAQGSTIIMVTHDQVEAMTLASRIMVMHDHQIQQIGTPLEIFSRPANVFVAQFVGATPMNILAGNLTSGAGGRAEITIAGAVVATEIPAGTLPEKAPWRIGLRAEYVSLETPAAGRLSGTVDFVERLGEQSWVHVVLPDGAAVVAAEAGVSLHQPGEVVGIRFDGARAHLFDADGKAYHPEPLK